ncbi:GATOR2 complex protein WDR24-like isoform X1 [Mytilus galloprovincialis]|uniref:GATOR2 complex protein WDR24-like isoform X2 n=1 Tax=Mytilus edulis TaxID=6550 RepID=UPI0039EE0E6D
MSVMHNVSKAVHDRVSTNNPHNSYGINCEGAVNAMDLNRDFSRVVVAGRNVFKIYTVEDDEFTEKFNLRVGRKLNLDFSVSDVAWSHIDDNILASAATNGKVVIWDLNKPSKSKQDFIFQEHTRTVNRVCFHQVEGNYILSGSHDGSLKIFDIRLKRVASTFSVGSTSIRDVQFCPSNFNYFAFAAADEGGNVQIWDMRRLTSPEKQFTAHGGPMFCLDWHPSEPKWLATGGRDRTIKIWDHALGKLLYSVPTIASVARIKWRPERKYHIASCSLVIDFSINVWDVRRPYIPFASFEEHKNVATGIVWKKDDGHTFYSSGKDNFLYQHVFKDAIRPADKVVPDGLDVSVIGHVTQATKDKTKSLGAWHREKKKYSMFSKQPDKGDQFIDAKSFVFSYTNCHQLLSMEWFVNCAKQYILHGRSFEEMCEHNAQVSDQNDRFQVAQSWRMLKAIYTKPTVTKNLLRTESVMSNVSEKPKDKVNQPDTPKSTEKDKQTMDATSEDDDMTDTDLSSIARGQINPPVEWDILFGGADVEQSFPTFGHMENIGPDFKLPKEAFVPRHEIKDPSEVPKQNNQDSPPLSANETEANPANNHNSKVNEDINMLLLMKEVEISEFAFTDCVEQMLKYFAEEGDVQTTVCMLVVLGERRPKIPEEIQDDWFISYLELLARFKLWTVSNTLINLSHLGSISMMNHQSTTINVTCNQCNRVLTKVGWLCHKCKSVINSCAVCHLPVKGLFVWCQGCSHGGHINHIQEWLTISKQCPTGCGHICEYT